MKNYIESIERIDNTTIFHINSTLTDTTLYAIKNVIKEINDKLYYILTDLGFIIEDYNNKMIIMLGKTKKAEKILKEIKFDIKVNNKKDEIVIKIKVFNLTYIIEYNATYPVITKKINL